MPAPTLPQSAPPTTFLSMSTFGATLSGTNGRDQLTAKAGRVGLVGGLGDDTYYTFKSSAAQSATSTAIYEDPNAGIDSVFSASSMTLPLYIENLTLTSTGGTRYAIGNYGTNAITSGAGNDHLNTGGGNDVMTGGAGRDSFTFTSHANTTSWVADFDLVNDKLILTNHGFHSLTEVQTASQQIGPDLRIALPNGQKVMLANNTIADLNGTNTLVDTPSGAASRQLTFSAEFDGPLSLNTGAPGTANGIWKTSFYNGDRGLAGNHDEQVYVDPDFKGKGSVPLGLNPFSVENGILKISAQPTDPAMLSTLWNIPYTSGMLSTQKSFLQQYGYFEIRADGSNEKGMFPAFWMLAPAQWPPEVDIYEQIGGLPDYVSQGAATLGGPFQNRGTHTGSDMTTGFHTYGFEWTAQTMTWFIDGQVTYRSATPADMHQPMYLILNLAVGGNWPGHPDASVDWSQANLQVDYIRAYKLEDAPSMLGIVLSNATNPKDLTDNFTLPAAAPGTSATFTGAQMAIAGVAAATTVTAAYAANGDLTLTNNAAWNTIKNATITDTSFAGHGVTVRNFVDVELDLGGGDDRIAIFSNKRATISSGGGQDTVTINGYSNSTSDNLTTVLAGDGDDVVTFIAGMLNRAYVDGGAGNDKLTVGGQAVGAIVGGVGDDVLADLSSGAVALTGGGGADGFAFSRVGKSTVTDYTPGVDHIELIGIAPAGVQVSLSGADTLLDLGSGASVRLASVALALADLDIRFLGAPSDPSPPPQPGVMQVILSNATSATDLSDSFELPAPALNSVARFTGAQMSIAGVAASVSVTETFSASGNLRLVNDSAWGAIKNATVSAGTGVVDLRNFVDVEITTGNAVDNVKVTGAKRGTIATGDGGDSITINGTSDDNVNNVLSVLAGNSTDTVSFGGGIFSVANIDGGAGNDSLTITGQAGGLISGGGGGDLLRDLSSGTVTLAGGAGIDKFSFSASGQSTVLDFETGIDRVELIGVTAGQVTATINGADTLLDLGGGASVKLIGVELTIAQINPLFA